MGAWLPAAQPCMLSVPLVCHCVDTSLGVLGGKAGKGPVPINHINPKANPHAQVEAFGWLGIILSDDSLNKPGIGWNMLQYSLLVRVHTLLLLLTR